MRSPFRSLFPDPALCTRCGHYEGLHRSRILYPPSWGNQLARPCIRVAPRGKGVLGCGCPDFVAPLPFASRALNALTHPRVVDVVVFLFFAGPTASVFARDVVWLAISTTAIVCWLLWVATFASAAGSRPKHSNGVHR